ncbi:hypothetical protein [Nocardia sp. CS682]|uniref:hypothetical protein n=1 Tax=Nocardia sp. CS682 TaxID=1047172 RepID=UPI001F100628|nr:hypothetical protein [Nocardia sp. CS682]
MRTSAEATARLRGAFVGSASGAVSIAAHALGGGVVAPGQSSIALLIAACTAVGVAVGARRTRHGLVEVMALLTIGQAVGHVALTMSPGHHHGAGTTAIMGVAHLLAIPVGALLIRGAEIAVTRGISAANRTARVLSTRPAVPFAVAYTVPIGPLVPARRLLFSSGFGLRGPPLSH